MLYNTHTRMPLLYTMHKHWSERSFGSLFLFIIGILLIFAYISEWSLWSGLRVFAHDELLYCESYKIKLSSEGRWLNFLLFPLLRIFNGYIVSLVNTGCLFVFSLTVLRRFLPCHVGIIAAIATVFFPPVHAMNYWPTTMLPSYITILGASLLYTRVPKWKLFLGCSLLLNGGLATFYFLIPLLYIGEEKPGDFCRTIIYWLAFFVVGVAFSELFTLLCCKHWIQPIEYRHFNLVDNIDELFTNIQRSWQWMQKALALYGGKLMLLCACITFVYMYSIFKQKKRGSIFVVPLLVLVSCSVYAHATVGGLIVEPRSALCLFFGVFLFCIWTLRRCPLAIGVISILFSSQMIFVNSEDIRYWNAIRNVMCDEIMSLPYKATELKGCALIAEKREYKNYLDRIARNWELTPTISSLNYLDSWASIPRECNITGPCLYGCEEQINKILCIDSSDVIFTTSGMFQHAKVNGYLILKFSPIGTMK